MPIPEEFMTERIHQNSPAEGIEHGADWREAVTKEIAALEASDLDRSDRRADRRGGAPRTVTFASTTGAPRGRSLRPHTPTQILEHTWEHNPWTISLTPR
jgi:hypothetical protein